MNTVAARLGSHVNNWIADAGCFAVKDLVVAEDAECKYVDERVTVVAFVEDAFASNGRNAKAVTVMRDPGDNAFQYVAVAIACFRVVQRSEPDRIHDRDRTRTHREDVAQNAAHARCRALERLNKARVVVRFDLKRDGNTIADIDDARILAGTLKDVPALGR